MRLHAKATEFIFAFALLAGCASTSTNRQTPMTAPGLPRPNQIWVYDFVAAVSDVPAGSSLAGRVGAPSTPPTAEELEAGRRYGAAVTIATGSPVVLSSSVGPSFMAQQAVDRG